MRAASIILAAALLFVHPSCKPGEKNGSEILMGVEFMDHAAAAYVAEEKGWYAREGLEVSSFDSYVTGMALSGAMVRGDVDAAYICLVPALSARVNGGAPIRVIAGTHRAGYSLVADSSKVDSVDDLEQARIGCTREGGAADVLLRKLIEARVLDIPEERIFRMYPQKLVLALLGGKIDAAMIPGNWAAAAAAADGYDILLTARDIWPGFQGSVLVAREDLLGGGAARARKLALVNEKATSWIGRNRKEAAAIVARHLRLSGPSILPAEASTYLRGRGHGIAVTPGTVAASMKLTEYSTGIDPSMVQDIIDFMHGAGYLEQRIDAEDILQIGAAP